MRSRFKLFERINITQRHTVLVVLALYFLGVVLATLSELLLGGPDPDGTIPGGIITAILFGGAWILYYKRNWEPMRYFVVLASCFFVGFFLPEPFISFYAPMVIVIPVVLALLVTGPAAIIATAILTFGILFIRAGGKGVYAHPTTITLYVMIVSGLLIGRLLSETSLRQFRQAQKKNQRQLEKLRGMRKIDTAIISAFDMRKNVDILLEETISQLGVSASSVLLFDSASQMLAYAAGIGFFSPQYQQLRFRITEGFGGRAARERRTVYVPDLRQAGRDFLNPDMLKEEGFVSAYAVPLIARGKLQGVLEIFHRSELLLDEEARDFLETLAGQAAIAIDNAQLFEDLQQSNSELALAYEATITGWSRAMDLRDKETEGHTQRVTDLTMKLARAMDIGDFELPHIRHGALLHDIGKMGVPDHILFKAAQLTEEEWEIMRKHPGFAYEMLSSIRYLQRALDIPYCHHEKWDGTGYPRGLKGTDIPIAARVFAVADVWDAITSNRPYRKAWSKARALEYMREQSGKHFDPQVVDTFFRVITEY